MIYMEISFWGFIEFWVASVALTLVNIKSGQSMDVGPVKLKRVLLIFIYGGFFVAVAGLILAFTNAH